MEFCGYYDGKRFVILEDSCRPPGGGVSPDAPSVRHSKKLNSANEKYCYKFTSLAMIDVGTFGRSVSYNPGPCCICMFEP